MPSLSVLLALGGGWGGLRGEARVTSPCLSLCAICANEGFSVVLTRCGFGCSTCIVTVFGLNADVLGIGCGCMGLTGLSARDTKPFLAAGGVKDRDRVRGRGRFRLAWAMASFFLTSGMVCVGGGRVMTFFAANSKATRSSAESSSPSCSASWSLRYRLIQDIIPCERAPT